MAETTTSGARERIDTDAQATALVLKMRAGERRATALVITELERLSTAAPILLRAMQPHLGHALVVGFTGPPGAGKSTLVNAVIADLRGAGKTVGVIAVDPSSPVSGGAILGDRIRMTAALDDDGVFVRSLASRGYLGGLSPAAVRIIDALDAAGRDVILLETVGTGQSEIDVAEVADVRVVISAPGLGDDIQAMKSGLLEIADIMVVNKGDRPGAEQTLQQLLGALSIRAMRNQKVPVLKTTATTGEGVPELVAGGRREGPRAGCGGPDGTAPAAGALSHRAGRLRSRRRARARRAGRQRSTRSPMKCSAAPSAPRKRRGGCWANRGTQMQKGRPRERPPGQCIACDSRRSIVLHLPVDFTLAGGAAAGTFPFHAVAALGSVVGTRAAGLSSADGSDGVVASGPGIVLALELGSSGSPSAASAAVPKQPSASTAARAEMVLDFMIRLPSLSTAVVAGGCCLLP